jgi:hypothetical protein
MSSRDVVTTQPDRFELEFNNYALFGAFSHIGTHLLTRKVGSCKGVHLFIPTHAHGVQFI